jgi:hypothetical protein
MPCAAMAHSTKSNTYTLLPKNMFGAEGYNGRGSSRQKLSVGCHISTASSTLTISDKSILVGEL